MPLKMLQELVEKILPKAIRGNTKAIVNFESLFQEFGKTIQDLEKIVTENKEVVRLEGLVLEYGKTVQTLEKMVSTLTRRLEKLTMDPTIGQDATGDSLAMNSFYIDKFPHHVDDFKDWDKVNIQQIYDSTKDRELHRFFDTAMGYLAAHHEGDYYEFGCCGAGSMRMALAKSLKWQLDDMDFYAFDSFQGFPVTGELAMSEADFIASVQAQGIKADRVETFPGFYDQSLTKELQQTFLDKPRRPMLVNVDCDLHDSAISVFEFIAPLLQAGTILYLDDFWDTFHGIKAGHDSQSGKEFGTARAFNEFCEKYPRLKFYPFMRVGCWGMSFIAYDPKVFTAPVV